MVPSGQRLAPGVGTHGGPPLPGRFGSSGVEPYPAPLTLVWDVRPLLPLASPVLATGRGGPPGTSEAPG